MGGFHRRYDILSRLSDMPSASISLFAAIMTAGYGASAKKIEWYMQHPSQRALLSQADREAYDRGKRFLNRMREKGLISVKTREHEVFCSITQQGRLEQDNLRMRFMRLDKKSLVPSPHPIILAFDIPEKYRGKRRWLRDCLRVMEFEQVQKSLWVGNFLFPEKYLEEIAKKDLSPYIKIFEIKRTII